MIWQFSFMEFYHSNTSITYVIAQNSTLKKHRNNQIFQAPKMISWWLSFRNPSMIVTLRFWNSYKEVKTIYFVDSVTAARWIWHHLSSCFQVAISPTQYDSTSVFLFFKDLQLTPMIYVCFRNTHCFLSVHCGQFVILRLFGCPREKSIANKPQSKGIQ